MNSGPKFKGLAVIPRCMFQSEKCDDRCVAFLRGDSTNCRILLIGKDLVAVLREVKNLLAKNAGR